MGETGGTKQVRVTVSLPEELIERANQEAETKGVSVSQVLRTSLREHLRTGSPTGIQPSVPPSTVERHAATDDDPAESGMDDESDRELFRLPFGSEFTPRTVGSLSDILDLAKRHDGAPKELQDALRQTYFSHHSGGDAANQRTLAYNCLLSMQSYGILDKEARFTSVGEALYALRADSDALHAAFAKHILTDRGGLLLLSAIRDQMKAQQRVTLESIRPALEIRGAYMPRGGKHVSSMRSWLQAAGIMDTGWGITESRVADVLGISLDDVDVFSGLDDLQKMFLRALAIRSSEPAPYPSNEVIQAAEKLSGIKFPEKSGHGKIIEPLEKAGLIKAEKTTGGRGGRAFNITPTAKFKAEMVEPVLSQLEYGANADLLRFLRMPIATVLDALKASTTHERGLALEALIIILMRQVGCHYVGTRVRGVATGGAEVDALFESRETAFVRWEVQCKNTSSVSTDDIAKEVGVAQMLGANAVVMITTGIIVDAARQFAQQVMKSTGMTLYLLDGEDIRGIAVNPTAIFGVFKRESVAAARLKRLTF
jgi:site-specific DNA-methyltransferase (cytosine-N4-specific)